MKLFKSFLVAATLCAALPAVAQDIMVDGAYIRSSGAMAKTGAAFMTIHNHGDADDRLIKVASPISKRAELHTHKEDANGVMQMLEVPEGFVIPADSCYELARGGDHVMFLGLNQPLEQGQTVPVTLTFEKAGDMVIEVPVQLAQGDAMPMQGDMQGMGHKHGQTPGN